MIFGPSGNAHDPKNQLSLTLDLQNYAKIQECQADKKKIGILKSQKSKCARKTHFIFLDI